MAGKNNSSGGLPDLLVYDLNFLRESLGKAAVDRLTGVGMKVCRLGATTVVPKENLLAALTAAAEADDEKALEGEWVSPDEAAQFLGLSTRTLCRLSNLRRVKSRREAGRRLEYLHSSLVAEQERRLAGEFAPSANLRGASFKRKMAS